MLNHCRLVFRLQSLALADVLHDLERDRIFEVILLNKDKHDAVASSDDL